MPLGTILPGILKGVFISGESSKILYRGSCGWGSNSKRSLIRPLIFLFTRNRHHSVKISGGETPSCLGVGCHKDQRHIGGANDCWSLFVCVCSANGLPVWGGSSGCSVVPTPLALFQSSNGFAPASVLGWLLKFTGNTLLRAPFCQLSGLPSTHSTPFTYFRAKKRKV